MMALLEAAMQAHLAWQGRGGDHDGVEMRNGVYIDTLHHNKKDGHRSQRSSLCDRDHLMRQVVYGMTAAHVGATRGGCPCMGLASVVCSTLVLLPSLLTG
jgi:hypothetical protein